MSETKFQFRVDGRAGVYPVRDTWDEAAQDAVSAGYASFNRYRTEVAFDATAGGEIARITTADKDAEITKLTSQLEVANAHHELYRKNTDEERLFMAERICRLVDELKHALDAVEGDSDWTRETWARLRRARALVKEQTGTGKNFSEEVKQVSNSDERPENASATAHELEEARAKAIEECAAIAKAYGGDCDQMITEFRSLLQGSTK